MALKRRGHPAEQPGGKETAVLGGGREGGGAGGRQKRKVEPGRLKVRNAVGRKGRKKGEKGR